MPVITDEQRNNSWDREKVQSTGIPQNTVVMRAQKSTAHVE